MQIKFLIIQVFEAEKKIKISLASNMLFYFKFLQKNILY